MLQYIEDAKQGDRNAFETIVRHYTAMGNAVAYEKLHDFQLAEDAVQEAFTEAFLHLRKLRTAEAFPGWFKAIVIRQCYRIMRRKHHHTVHYEEAAQSLEMLHGISDQMAKRELQQVVHDSLAVLTSNMRIVVQLFYFQGYSLQEISSFLGTSIPALKKRLFDARRKLKSALPAADLISVYHDLYEGGKGVLHIVNGDSVAEKLRQGIVQGDILVWREVYPHGPIFVDPSEWSNRSIRAQYLEQSLGIPRSVFIQGSEMQDKALAEFHKYDEIVLWFEHDLFDQTILCYLLHWFSGQSLGKTKLNLLSIGDYPGIELFRGLGQLSLEQMGTLPGTWKSIGTAELELGSALWLAYSSQNPQQLQQLLTEDTSVLPYAQDAFQCHLSCFPSTSNGLGIVEQSTMELICSGVYSPLQLFERVGNKLHTLGMGDLQFWYILGKMAHDPYPLLRISGSDVFPGFNDSVDNFRNSEMNITDFGRSVLDGKEDRIVTNGIDEWYGGVRLEGNAVRWRWDSASESIQDLKAED
ncbi:sigma-70 family RNA polymerase sigma factor [Paenibacillus nasutitermitis]|uniref:RNA polymerase subunit sigma n=1 Tax=Paenibacillus nasutitermitis TaxID=1652958 RepID=A0A917DR49_9BACL|nr:sigma-70 family RNA polymerase sigma factor [Paenibacillus nasutitermitis]GGD58655.1 hypothetical protein GCM10010911_15600 [Paenibacillus nasutitermitis]